MSSISSAHFAVAAAVSGSNSSKPKGGVGAKNLAPQQQKQVAELKKRDSDVRQHEAAHLAASGGYARGGASFTFETGPDGKQYAVGGEVKMDASPVPNNPRATIAKMQIIEAAALAPSDPSGQDRSVAAGAAAQAAKAQAELASQKTGQDKGGSLDIFA